jgi:protein-S-isoprenylcysteine O-methyltransferase Ste14
MRLILLPPIVVLLCAGVMVALHLNAPLARIVPQPFNWPGVLLVVGGIALSKWHASLFKRVGTNINTFGEPGQLTTEGLFRRTRNPMYLGMLIALLGLAWALGSLSPLLGPLVFFGMAQFWYIPLEERALVRKFGDAYGDYQRAVRRWL